MKKEAISIIHTLKTKSLKDPDNVANRLEEVLEQYHMDDGFGTEGQSDPRGDFRDGSYSMWSVESDNELQSQHERNSLVLDRMEKLFEDDSCFAEFVVEMKDELEF